MVFPLIAAGAAAALPELLPLLREAAPWIVRQLSGGDETAEAVAGQVVQAVAAVAGVAEPAALEATLADPERRAALVAELERIHADAMAERERQATERLRLTLEGVANARAMGGGSPGVARTQARLAWAVLALFAGVLAALFWRGVPQGAEALINVMLGVLTAAIAGVMGFYFGSSYGSQQQRADLATIAGGGRLALPAPESGRLPFGGTGRAGR